MKFVSNWDTVFNSLSKFKIFFVSQDGKWIDECADECTGKNVKPDIETKYGAFQFNLVFLMNLISEPEPDSEWSQIVVGSAGLLLGLLFSIAGFIYYKTTSNGEAIFHFKLKNTFMTDFSI